MTRAAYSEDALVEQPAIKLFKSLEWEHANCFHEFDSGESFLGRETKSEVVLVSRLRPALEQLNPDLPPEAFDQAIEEITRDRSAMSMAAANREIFDLLKNGVKVTIPDADGEGETVETVRVMDWNNPDNNDYFLASQFWVTGELYTRRADLVGFVNGIPLVFVELKATHKRLKNAYDRNLTDYKTAIPQLFWFNGLIILSNGSQSRIGSMTAGWEHFAEWKRINSEGEEGVVSLETMIRGTCDRERLLDLVENFMIFQEVRGGLIKLVAKNHQYLGVNKAIEAVRSITSNQGRLGVFWHTQGSGKSVAMVFYSQKVLRKMPGNWTFVVVTDRQDLDNQIYKTFASAGVVTEKQAQAETSAHLRQLLREDHRYVFTLIQKFLTKKGERHPVLSERRDVIVIADEAHRTQYDTLAMNMRTALPNAAFIAFTGTPLLAGEEKTRKVFGDYTSIYNFKQSVDDEATVPLHYENRIPELQLTNKDLNEDIYRVVEEAELSDEQEQKLEREFGRQYHLITRDDRLEKITEDIVAHYMGRGFRGKAMVVSVDKATAIRMYDKVQEHWKAYRSQLQADVKKAKGEERAVLEAKLRYMDETDMAVVVSQGQNEVDEMKKKGLDIVPHRRRMVKEDLDEKFKDPDDHLRIVFVCAMWMTGFDVPSCSTIYVDKPMRNHTLMQTIARANRVFGDKVNGLIVDYVGVFRNLQKALTIYGSSSGGGVKPGELPVKEKAALVEDLKKAIAGATAFCKDLGFDLEELLELEAFDKVAGLVEAVKSILLKDPSAFDGPLGEAVEAALLNDETKRRFVAMANHVTKLYRAVLPDPAANELAPVCTLIGVIADKIRSLAPPADISDVMGSVEEVLDESIAAEGYVIHPSPEGAQTDHVIDLSKLDLERLQKRFKTARKRTEAEKLRSTVNRKLRRLVRLNRTRLDYSEKFQKLIEEYNAGAINVEVFFDRLVQFARELTEEEQRHIAEHLSEEELALFDLLIKPEMTLSEKEKKQVKTVARDLLETLRKGKLVLDWRKHQQSRAAVRLAIEETLDHLPTCYASDIYERKCDVVFQHFFDSYSDADKNVYAA